MKRREFLTLGTATLASSVTGASGLIAWSSRAYASTITSTLHITEGLITQPDGVEVYFRGFSDSSGGLNVPGTRIDCQVGDNLVITIVNHLDETYGFAVDGVNVSTVLIPPGAQRTFSFTANEAGTYMYYDPTNAPYHRLSGLHGMITVMPSGSSSELYPGSPQFDQQYGWVFHDIDPQWHQRFQQNSTPNTAYNPVYFTLNGLSGRPPNAPGAMDPAIDSMADPRSKIDGHLGQRTLVRCLNVGQAQHAVHCHGNHMEWLSSNRQNHSSIWQKDVIPLAGRGGTMDFIFPFDPPPDAWPTVSNNTLAQAEAEGRHFAFPMHLHDEMTQTAGGGMYMFGALTDIYYHAG